MYSKIAYSLAWAVQNVCYRRRKGGVGAKQAYLNILGINQGLTGY